VTGDEYGRDDQSDIAEEHPAKPQQAPAHVLLLGGDRLIGAAVRVGSRHRQAPVIRLLRSTGWRPDHPETCGSNLPPHPWATALILLHAELSYKMSINSSAGALLQEERITAGATRNAYNARVP
jgi:hypothetical protein